MEFNAGLFQKQTLKLAMTQELTQAIALLQYSAHELAAFLEEKAIENPLIQVDFKNIRSIDPCVGIRNKASTVRERDQKNWIEQIGETSDTLHDHLLFQLNTLKITANQRRVIVLLIKHIDENGYLGAGIEETAQKLGLGLDEVENSLNILQGMEPAGVGARSLQECLLLQLERREYHQHRQRSSERRNGSIIREYPQGIMDLAASILTEHFILFAEKRWKSLAKLMKTDIKEIQKAFDFVQCLDPRPGAAFQKDRALYVVPDVVVRREHGTLTVGLFDDTMPRITFNEGYYSRLASYQDSEVARFLQEKQSDYQWIIKSLEQRRETLMRVALKIVEKQPHFFEQGPSLQHPMTMKEIAEELGIHESTVSRAVREKYIQTPVGTYELKSFFTSSLSTTEQDQTSSSHVKVAIGQLIKMEDKKKPMSDQNIVQVLAAKSGIVISRRTVAKYREQLGIPSSSKRKRFD
ncbi:RNA polymerase factor sigma-54 [Mesobacillus foraminis]|uniref:RNA polymerase RpoN-/SigL-like sigma 54 subunit n=1 Tax=Mesobacillus foraminis TaxID=279826 RepID=A0A4V2RE04_9BACI|nr:RNA polymerase factor sigma-54 [Mesobacillus foraminis]TCN26820.1 RNA polymerase RpoN-/SigL-like sigma 54 subunit [Mesobacillus foraminis]